MQMSSSTTEKCLPHWPARNPSGDSGEPHIWLLGPNKKYYKHLKGKKMNNILTLINELYYGLKSNVLREQSTEYVSFDKGVWQKIWKSPEAQGTTWEGRFSFKGQNEQSEESF